MATDVLISSKINMIYMAQMYPKKLFMGNTTLIKKIELETFLELGGGDARG